jgi:hypothetical protein
MISRANLGVLVVIATLVAKGWTQTMEVPAVLEEIDVENSNRWSFTANAYGYLVHARDLRTEVIRPIVRFGS